MCAPENICVTPLFEVSRAGQIDKELQRLSGDAVFAVVDVKVADGDGEVAPAIGIVVEELAKVGLADLFVMPAQGFPCRGGRDVG